MVRFRGPEGELSDVTYPLIVIEQAGYSRAPDREHRGDTRLPYVPEEENSETVPAISKSTGELYNWDPSDGPTTDSPVRIPDSAIPYNVDWQVTVYTRLNNHMMQIVPELAKIERIPTRFGWLIVPENNTVRSLELLGGPEIQPSKDQDGKRLFSTVYSVRAATELNLYGYSTDLTPVETVNIELEQILPEP